MSAGFSSESLAGVVQQEAPQLRIYEAPPESFVDGLIKKSMDDDRMLKALAGLCCADHDALMRLIEHPALLASRDPADRDLVVSGDRFLQRMINSINAIHTIDPGSPVYAELMRCYERCRKAFPKVFQEQDY